MDKHNTKQIVNLELINYQLQELKKDIQGIRNELDGKFASKETVDYAIKTFNTQIEELKAKAKFQQGILYTVGSAVVMTVLYKVLGLVIK